MSKQYNPFAQFTARKFDPKAASGANSANGAGGWLSTKKRGRDDDAIERDRSLALEKRRAKKKKSVHTKPKPSLSKTKSSKSRAKKSTSWSEDDDDEEEEEVYDEDGFIVMDEDEDERDWNESDDDDDEELEEELILDQPRRKTVSKPIWKDDDDEDDDDDDDDIIDTPESNKKEARRRHNDNKNTITVVDSDDEVEFEDDDHVSPLVLHMKKKERSKFFQKPVPSPVTASLDDEESSDDDDVMPPNKLRKGGPQQVRNQQQQRQTRPKEEKKISSRLSSANPPPRKPKVTDTFRKKMLVIESSSSSEDEQMKRIPQKQKPKTNKKKLVSLQVDSDDEGLFTEYTSTKTSAIAASATVVTSTDSSTRRANFFHSDSDHTPAKQKKTKNASKQAIHVDDDDDSDLDEDEKIAIALAMSESQAMKQSQSQSSSKSNNSQDEEDVLLEEDEEDDDEDDNSDAHIDKSEEERRSAAAKVLNTAKRLSQTVLQSMLSWGATQGMIMVEGALALNKSSVAKISQAELQKNIAKQITLAEYQVIGVNWMALLHEMKVDIGEKTNVNGILADVMGLGKTIQTIAFLAWLHSKNRPNMTKKTVVNICDSDDSDANEEPKPIVRVKPHIIVVPASVLDNWMAEFKKVAPQLTVIKYHGSLADRENLKFDLEKRLPHRKKVTTASCDVDVVLTTFSYFSGNKADDRVFLRKFDFDYMVVDEAHCLKNPDSNAYQNLDRFDTAHRLLLTGTPVQNSPKELMSLICFLMPFFKKAGSVWDEEDGKQNDGGASMLEYFVSLEGGDIKSDEAAYRKLKQLFAPFVLRRRKEDVFDDAMPKKTREVIHVELTPEMRCMYDSILAAHLNGKNKKAIGGNASDRQHLFTALRKVANHPLLLRNRHTDEKAVEHLATQLRMYGYFGRADSCTLSLVKKELEKFSDFAVHHAALDMIDENPKRREEMQPYLLDESDLFCSPKLERLRTLIPELIENGHRLLIFSQWTNCLDLLGCLLESLSLEFFRLDGQTPIASRQEMINEFTTNKDIPVFLLSTKAGGMGINLTAADVCILHDLDFNPFNDLQAEDRCHRIGQTKPVRVIKMVTKDTVDDDIYEMQQRKTEMNAAILEKGGTINAAEEKKKDNEEIKSMLQHQLDRYLMSQK